jgi:hypothetical protein
VRDHRPPATQTTATATDQAGFGALATVISLAIVALATLGTLVALPGTSAPRGGTRALGTTVTNAYDVEAQSNLSTAMENILNNAVADGGLAGLDIAPYGVTPGPSTSPQQVSGAVADATVPAGGPGGPLGSGSVTPAAQSRSGTCWYVWFSASDTWFGLQPDAVSCVAKAMVNEPAPGRPAPGTIGWQSGSFPPA